MIAEIRDATIQNTMVKPRGRNISPVIPLNIARGRNTTQVVSVEPTTDWYTTPVPFKAALENSLKPVSVVALKQLSSTTVELSTIIPTPNTSAQGDDVQAEAHELHEYQGGQDRHRDGTSYNQRGLQVPEEQPYDDHGMITAIIMVSITELREDMMESLSSFTTVI